MMRALSSSVAIGLAVAALWALAHGGGFPPFPRRRLVTIGALMILLGASGQSTADRVLETSGRIPGMPAWTQSKPGDVSVRPGALMILAGLVLIGLGILLDAA
jgi:hypothetical protein